jgi:hypothetical protein
VLNFIYTICRAAALEHALSRIVIVLIINKRFFKAPRPVTTWIPCDEVSYIRNYMLQDACPVDGMTKKITEQYFIPYCTLTSHAWKGVLAVV